MTRYFLMGNMTKLKAFSKTGLGGSSFVVVGLEVDTSVLMGNGSRSQDQKSLMFFEMTHTHTHTLAVLWVSESRKFRSGQT